MSLESIIWLNNAKYIAEIIYLICGPLLAYIAYKALDQIKVSKSSSKVQSLRESYRLAAERCEFFNDRIIPARKTLKEACIKHDITLFDKSESSIENGKIIVKSHDLENQVQKLLLIGNELNDIGNNLDLFAVYFTSNIADESLAYRTLGKLYCDTVKELLPVLAPLSKEEQVEHIFQLFILWSKRIDSEKIIKDKEKLIKELQDLETKGLETATVKPIGTT